MFLLVPVTIWFLHERPSDMAGIGCVIAAVVYGFLCPLFNLPDHGHDGQFGVSVLFVGGACTMCETFNGFGYTLAELSLMDLAVRATPNGSEGQGLR